MQSELPQSEPPAARYPQPAYRLAPPKSRRHRPEAPQISLLSLLARLVVVSLGVTIAVDLVDIVLRIWATRRELAGAGNGDTIIQIADHLWLAQSTAWVATAAPFIWWLFLARRNLVVWRVHGLGWEPGWAIYAWCIPVANLFIPPLVMSAVVRGSQVAADRTASPPGAPVLLSAWWITYVCGPALGTFVQNSFAPNESIVLTTRWNTTVGVLSIAAAGLAITLVRRVTALQERRSAAVAEDGVVQGGL